MFKRKSVNLAALLALGALSAPVFAQQQLERVEVTGSSIKRIAAEGALPVVVLTKADIEKTGATSAAELIQGLTGMQGFTQGSDSVNGGGGGATTAALRGLGAQYTLVLLNGRRVAPYTSGSDVNLEVLPLSMVKRVEVLVDGASATYGADAVAGVVNFITESDTESGGFDIKFGTPQRAGGGTAKLSVSKGFGSMAKDGWNIVAGATIESQERIRASERPWTARGGVFNFMHEGKEYEFFQSSGNTNPPNATVNGVTYNPFLVLNGNCGPSPASFSLGANCRYNFAQTVDLQPSYDRQSFYANGRVAMGSNWQGFFEALVTTSSITAAYAPPAQPFGITNASPLWNRYIAPTMVRAGVPDAALQTRATIRMRLEDAGPRTDKYETNATHLVAGVNGVLAGWDVAASLTSSKNDLDDIPAGGYASFVRMNELIAQGRFDPYAQGSQASKDGIRPAVLTDSFSVTKSKLDTVKVNASNAIFKAGGGDAYLGLGAEFTRQLFQVDPSLILQAFSPIFPDADDFIVGGNSGSVPTKATRNVKSAFGELIVPLAKSLETTAAVRYDSYDAVENATNYDPLTGLPKGSAVQGKAYSKSTYKVGLRFQPSPEWLFRASYGTGFRAPTLAQISNPVVDFGVISGFKACPVPVGDPNRAGCRSTPYEYRLLRGGTPDTGGTALRPENTKQATAGFRFEPNANFSGGLDYWQVEIKDALQFLDQDIAFAQYDRYKRFFTVTPEPGTGDPVLTLNQTPINSAVNKASGIDWDLNMRMKLAIGQLTLRYQGTYLLKNEYDFGFGSGVQTSLGKFGSDSNVALRVQSILSASLRTGGLDNTLTMRHRTGYTDATGNSVEENLARVDGGDVAGFSGLKIKPQYLFDWQTRYAFNKDFSVTLGVKNLLDKEPPLSLKATGSNMVGVDPRYSDTVGRSYYVSGSYKF